MKPTFRSRAARSSIALLAIAGVSSLIALAMVLPTSAGPATTQPSGAAPAAPESLAPAGHAAGLPAAAPVPAAAPARSESPGPSTSSFNPPCYPVWTYICVSIQDPGEPDIIPSGTDKVSPVMPLANTSIPLVVHSGIWLNSSGTNPSPSHGPHAPIQLNVTGTLWNGDPYMSEYDDSTYHADGNTWWQYLGESSNKTYPHLYLVNISASNGGKPNFFAGEEITWWIYIVIPTSNITYDVHAGPRLSYTYQGAWPFSPDPGAPHYGGAASTSLDVSVTATPRAPNWNDSVRITVNTTPADVEPYNATIGACILDFVEVAHGIVIQNTSLPFNVTVSPTLIGNYTTSIVIPAAYAQVAKASVSYRIWITDTAVPGDQIVTPWTNYSVNGNGSFENGIFASDIVLSMTPATVLIDQFGYANLTPGQELVVTVQSRDPQTAILSAQIEYTVSYPALHESLSQSFTLKRVASTYWIGTMPGFPVDTIVNFTVYAWDFGDAVEYSEVYDYHVMTFAQYVPPLSLDQAFFYVYVYDNGSKTWVQGATVQIQGANGGFNSKGNTSLGVAYANVTNLPYDPLVLQANTTYNVTVNDPRFVPGGGKGAYGPISVQVVALYRMTAEQPLASTPDYVVLQQGDQILFYLNATGARTVASPTVATGNPLGDLGLAAALGLVGAALAVFPMRSWWKQIKARRTEEEKRVTL